jgi:UDP-glucuronate 4-epimerase
VYSKLYGIKTTCLRFFTVYGPRQRPDMAIHKFTRLATEDRALPMMGSGTYRDYTYISDIIDGVVRAMGKDFDFEVFNLGTTKTIKIEELISVLGEELKKEVKIDRMPRQKGDVVATHADIGKAREGLGYEPKVEIRKGIRLFVDWYRNRG